MTAANEASRETADTLTCPWCQTDMEPGYLYSGDSIRWVDRRPGAIPGALSAGKALYVSDEGIPPAYNRCWVCPSCRRLVARLSGEAPPSPEECRDEFLRYARQAKGRK
jgi:hypothetical protein